MGNRNNNVFPTGNASNDGRTKFTNVWTGPAQNPPGSGSVGPMPIVSTTLTWGKQGGHQASTRTLVGPYRLNWTLPANWPTNGWRPIHANVGQSKAFGQWNPYTSQANQTPQYLDWALAHGFVTFYLDGDLGNAGSRYGRAWPGGWWMHPAKGVWPADLQNFTWAMAKIGANVLTATNAINKAAGLPTTKMPLAPAQPGAIVGGRVIAPVPVAVKSSPWPLIGGGVGLLLLAGVAIWAID